MVYKPHDDDTIAGIATPPGEGGLGVIRLSGHHAIQIADALFQSKSGQLVSAQKSFTAQYGFIISKDNGSSKKVDEVILTLMRAPKSYTCEDVVEISAHGGIVVLQEILDLATRHGARLAERGEFTKRAFLNGRIDLLQAEAVLDLVQAKTQLGRAWASERLEGSASKKIKDLKRELIEILTHLEAAIDFPDDFPDTQSIPELSKRLGNVLSAAQALAAASRLGMIVKKGLGIVIAGRPNVGKSSLMNEITRTNRVIVTPHPGTTRDVVEAEVHIQGILARLQDTAGIQSTEHPIEKEGIERSKRAVDEADLVLYVLDASEVLSREDEALIRDLKDKKKKIFVLNKMDLPILLDPKGLQKLDPEAPHIQISCTKQRGIEELEDLIFKYVTQGVGAISEAPVISTVRQKDCLDKGLKTLSDALEACAKDLSPELIAVDVRLTIDHLGTLSGDVYTDDILEVLFNQFCIGK